MKPLCLLCWLIILCGTAALAQSNPVPLINQPLIPMTVKPGSQGFTLTVNGAGFASTAVVSWNGSTRITSFISSTQLQAQINAVDVASAGTAWVTVVNPSPGGGTSNVVFFPIQTPTPAADLFPSNFSASGVNAVGDFNNDGILDLAVYSASNGEFFINVYFGNGDGTFHGPFQNHSVTPIAFMLAADFNGDGKLDVAALDGLGNVIIFLSHGNGILIQRQVFRSPNHGNVFLYSDNGLAVGDFNGDGKLDLVVTCSNYSAVYLGNGDGTFGGPQYLKVPALISLGNPAVADFNGDGKLDLALPEVDNPIGVHVLLGNGDGTFKPDVFYSTQYGGFSAAAADVNGDGKVDIVTDGVSILLGNGDGTFTNGGGVGRGYGSLAAGVSIGDFNGDGKLDLAVSSPIQLLLGNGDGTFQNPTLVANESPANLAMGDFNGDGKLDLVGVSLYLQTPVDLSPSSLNFGSQKVGTKSPPQTIVVTNGGTSTLTVTNIGIGGNDPNDFAQTNNCGSLPVGGQCKVDGIFQPMASGSRSASLNVSYQGFGSPQTASLSGVGTVATVTLTPSQLKFQLQLVGTTSAPQQASLTNTGNLTVNISNISTTGPFTQTNNCPSSLAVGASCQVQVKFVPQQRGHASGKLSVTDDAQGSPQTVVLSGNGTVVKLSTIGINFGNQKVGTKSGPAPVKLTNVGKSSLTIYGIAFKGKDPGDFSQSNHCGNRVPAGGSCTINVTFTPQALGKRSASLQISDNGGGSPQKVALSGNGI